MQSSDMVFATKLNLQNIEGPKEIKLEGSFLESEMDLEGKSSSSSGSQSPVRVKSPCEKDMKSHIEKSKAK